MTFISKSANETISFGKRLGRLLEPGDVVALVGELGAGKTTLTKGIALGLGVKAMEYVTSPSFVIAREYKGRVPLYHLDLFRLDKDSQLDTTGFEEYVGSDGVCVIEWAGKVESVLPKEHLTIEIEAKGENERRIRLAAAGGRYKRLIGRLRL